ncbi:MAG: peptide chain release factor N(5)-glutamine methyltransferase [Actinomycetota bacterium]
MADEPDTTTTASDGVTWGALAIETTARLAVSSRPEVAELAEAHGRLIAMRASGAEPGEWLDRARDLASVRGVAALDAMTARRLQGEPLQYVLGEWSFRRIELFVDRRVLIPRPETEVVAGLALRELERLAAATGDARSTTTAVDLGTGSGAIGLSLAVEHERVDVWLTDVSADALAVARANLAGIGRAGARVRVAEGSWFDALPAELLGRLGLVVSNPPYVADGEALPAEVADWEPASALFGGTGGTDHLELLVADAPRWLRSDGALVLEMAPEQTGAVAERAAAYFAEVEVHPDLVGRDRAVVARRPRAEWS